MSGETLLGEGHGGGILHPLLLQPSAPPHCLHSCPRTLPPSPTYSPHPLPPSFQLYPPPHPPAAPPPSHPCPRSPASTQLPSTPPHTCSCPHLPSRLGNPPHRTSSRACLYPLPPAPPSSPPASPFWLTATPRRAGLYVCSQITVVSMAAWTTVALQVLLWRCVLLLYSPNLLGLPLRWLGKLLTIPFPPTPHPTYASCQRVAPVASGDTGHA